MPGGSPEARESIADSYICPITQVLPVEGGGGGGLECAYRPCCVLVLLVKIFHSADVSTSLRCQQNIRICIRMCIRLLYRS